MGHFFLNNRYFTILCTCLLFSINLLQAQTNVNGVISIGSTWTKAGSPYNITGNTQISVGDVLTIEPGTKIIFNGDYSFKAFGNIIAIGTATDSIFFETNSPNTKIGKGIYVRSTATALFDVNYNYLSGTRFKYCSFNNLARGIFNHESGVSIENCGFYNNDIAWEPRSNLQTLVSNSSFKNNNYGLFTFGEDQTTGDIVSCVKDILITDNDFNGNITGISIGMNQRAVANFKVTKNKFYKNSLIAVSIGGGGYGPYVGDNVEISYNNFIENANAVTLQVYNLGYNGCSGGGGGPGMGTNSELLISKNSFFKDKNGVNLNGIAYANVTKNIFNSNQRGVYIGTNSDRRSNNTIQFNQFLKVDKPVEIYANGIYYQTDNNLVKKNTFQSFLFKQINPIISINTRVNNNQVTENNFSLYDNYLIKNTDIGNVPFFGNYTMPSRTIANDILDQNDNIDLGVVQISTPSSTPIVTAPISMPIKVVKSLSAGQVILTWTANTESDIAGYKIYYGGYTGYSYTTPLDAGNVLTYTLPAGVSIDEDIAVTAYDASKDGTDDQFDGNESWYSPANKAPAIAVISAVTPTERQVQLTWDAITNASKYNIYKSTDSSTFTLLTTVNGTTYTDASLNTLQQRYYYKVAAFDSLDLSYDSYGLEGPHSAIKGAKPINKPTISSVESFTDAIKLNFTYNSSLAGITNVKVYRSAPTEARALIATLAATASTYTNTVVNDILYTYDVTITNASEESDASITKSASGFSISSNLSPINNQLDVKDAHVYKWSKIKLASTYKVELDTVNTFNSGALIQKTILDTNALITDLIQNQNYFWRVKSGDDNGYSSWSSINTFQTYVKEATISSVIAANKNDTLKFTLPSSRNISKIYILRDTIDNPIKIIDSSASIITTYLDTIQLNLNQKYYYSIQLLNGQGVRSNYATSKNATPFNTRPKSSNFENKTFNNVGEFNFVRTTYSAAESKDIDGKIVNYKWYVNDSLVNSSDSILIYYYNQGTNDLKLVITDNDGDKDSSLAKVVLNMFSRTFKGGFLGGITALSSDRILTADSTFDPINGASVYMLDRAGNTIFPLIVSSKIFTTPSVSTDSSIFITSGSSLNGFSKTGAPLWSTIPLGGNSFVTPTIDSLFSRIYLGVSNKNFFAIDYKTGKVAWNIIGDAAINSSAVITGDRKLVFTSQSGTLYGYDIRTNAVQTAAKWKYSIGELVSKSPAVDASNNLYIGTDAGNLVKLNLKDDSSVIKVWSINLSASIQSSAVIDGDGFIYIGNERGDFYKINPIDGAIVWTYSTGAAIRSTPAISDFGSIYFANMNGLVSSIAADKSIKWKYQESAPISANLLYINYMIYAGTEAGKLFSVYDNPASNTVNTTLSIIGTPYYLESYKVKSMATDNTLVNKKPIWGTFQGNYRRTGSRDFDCPQTPIVKIPDCIVTGDSIRISTTDLVQKYWVVNDKNLDIKDTVIYVKPTDKIKIVAFNTNGCNVSSGASTIIPNSDVAKPTIITNTGYDKFCQNDSITLSTPIGVSSYQWNFAGYPISNARTKTLTTNLSGAYSLTVVNSFGCKSVSDISLIMSIAKPDAPTITRDTAGNLVSSSLIGNQWYDKGVVIDGATSKIYKPKSPSTFSVTTNSYGCMSVMSSSYYFLVTDILNLSSTEFIKLVPNPFINQLNFDFVVKGYQRLNLEVFDMATGTKVASKQHLTPGMPIYLGELSSGTYVIKVSSSDNKVAYQFKMVKL